MYLSVVLVVLAVLLVSCAGEAPTKGTVSAAIKDTSVDGLKGLNIVIAAPFKVQDYVVGFKYMLDDLKRAPESLFARKSFETMADGTATIDADYALVDNTLDVEAEWKCNKYGLNLFAKGDNHRMKNVKAEKEMEFDSKKVLVRAMYDFPKNLWKGGLKYKMDSISVDVECDTETQDPRIELTKAIDDTNEVSPFVNAKSGKLGLGYKRSWAGGSVKSVLSPGEKVDVEWKDEGATGTWNVKTMFPLEGAAQPTISIGRDWNY